MHGPPGAVARGGGRVMHVAGMEYTRTIRSHDPGGGVSLDCRPLDRWVAGECQRARSAH